MPVKRVRYQRTKKPGKFIKRTGAKAKGLTKKQRDQVAKIAKGSVTQVAEKKYMNSENIVGENPVAIHGNNRISVMGISTQGGVSPGGSVINYGSSEIKQLKCLRYYSPTGMATDNNVIIGKECRPVSSRSAFKITRQAANLTELTDGDLEDYHTNPPEGGPPSGSDLALSRIVTACPVMCRMIRVTPKISPGIRTEIAPNSDLFINDRGDPTGVTALDFSEAQLMSFKVNRRRYTVLQDMTFSLENPLAINWSWVQSESAGTGDHSGWWAPTVTNGSNKCEKYFNVYHQLTQKKHGSIRYADPAHGNTEELKTQPLTGHRREYIFFHWFYKGADAMFRTPNNEFNSAPFDITVNCINTTKFIDV